MIEKLGMSYAEKKALKRSTELGQVIKNIVAEKGPECLQDTEDFLSCLKEKGVDNVTSLQLGLVLDAGNIRRYLPQVKTGLTMIDVNNIVSVTAIHSGLTRYRIKLLLTAILRGLNLQTSLETAVIPNDEGLTYSDRALLDAKTLTPTLDEVRKAIESENETKLKELSVGFKRMVDAGIPQAQYLNGLCCLKGIGTNQDDHAAYRYFRAAAAAGHAEASALMGDYYFSFPSGILYTKAFNYYTQVGAVSLSKERQEKLKIILDTKKQNITHLILAGVLLILCLAFNHQIGMGAFSPDGSSHMVSAVISSVLSSLTFAAAIWYCVAYAYSGTKWVPTVMMIITAIFAIFAV